jgi:hypothetical protein
MRNTQITELPRIPAWSQLRLRDNEERKYKLARGISNIPSSHTLHSWIGGKRFREQPEKNGAPLRSGGAE